MRTCTRAESRNNRQRGERGEGAGEGSLNLVKIPTSKINKHWEGQQGEILRRVPANTPRGPGLKASRI